MNPRFSFIICSWQAPATLDDALESIFRDGSSDSFEVILVNNGFEPERANQLSARFPGTKIIDEPKPGLSHAHFAAFRVARGEFFVCLDDDNFVGQGFTPRFLDLISRHANLGGICPLVAPRWEKIPPPWLQEFGLCCLSYNAVAVPATTSPGVEQVWHYPDLGGCAWPPGGGMIIHRLLAEDYLSHRDQKRAKLGRIRGALGSSEDQDIYGRTFLLKRDVAYSDRLIVFHQIPAARTKWWYLIRLNFRMTQSWAVLARMWRRENHPHHHSSPRDHLRQLRQELKAFLRGRLPPPRALLELVRHAGFLFGWAKDACRGD